MLLKNLKIETQFKISFSLLLLLLMILGSVAYIQISKIDQQLETMYTHPVKVRRAIGEIRIDFLNIQHNMKNLLFLINDLGSAANITQIEIAKANAFDQIDILYSQYLGPRTDIDSLRNAFVTYNSACAETIRLMRIGKIKEGAFRTEKSATLSKQSEAMLAALQTIDKFSIKKPTLYLQLPRN
jgi:hypothetical protein